MEFIQSKRLHISHLIFLKSELNEMNYKVEFINNFKLRISRDSISIDLLYSKKLRSYILLKHCNHQTKLSIIPFNEILNFLKKFSRKEN